MHQHESPHSGLLGEIAIHPHQVLSHQVSNLCSLREVNKSGVGQSVTLSPLAHHGEIDVDHSRNVVLVLATYDHDVLDIRAEPEPALNILGGILDSRTQLTHMLQPVQEYQMSLLVDGDRIAGMAPTVHQDSGGLPRVIMIATEHRVTPDQQFPFISYPDLGSNCRPPYAFKGDLPSAMRRDKSRFGAGIALSQLNTYGMNKPEGIKAQYRTPRDGKPDFAQPQLILERFEYERAGNSVNGPPKQVRRFALESEVGNFVTYRQKQVIAETLQRIRVNHLHLNFAHQALPLPRTVYNEVGASLAGVLSDGFWLLSKVQPGSSQQMGDSGEEAIAYPGSREAGN